MNRTSPGVALCAALIAAGVASLASAQAVAPAASRVRVDPVWERQLDGEGER
jgi:hypothetical protein